MVELPAGGYRPPTAMRYTHEGAKPVGDTLPLEEPLEIEVNGRPLAVLMRTPGDDKSLALGYCLSEGIVRSPDEVLLIHHCGSGEEQDLLPAAEAPALGAGNRVRLLLSAGAVQRLQGGRPTEASQSADRAQGSPVRWVFSGCAGVDVAALGEELRVGAENLRLAPAILFEAVAAVGKRQEQYRESGGSHAAALLSAGGEVLSLAEDVGRHNAADKAIGLAALAGALPAALLVATGRASSDIVAKAARVGIPVVASYSSTTSLAVRLAEAAGVTLIGYLRRTRFTVYTHPERIAGDTAC